MADLYGGAGGAVNPSPDPPRPGMGGTLYIKSNDGSETLYSRAYQMMPMEAYYYLDNSEHPNGVYYYSGMVPVGGDPYSLLYSLADYPGLNTAPNQSDPNIESGQSFDISSSDVTVYVVSEKKNINKIIKNGETVLDLTGDTVAADKLLSGYTAHDSKGEPIEGTIEIYDGSVYSELWIFNETILIDDFWYEISFTSNKEKFIMLQSSPYVGLMYNQPLSNTIAYGLIPTTGWTDEAFRTIALDEPATGDFLTWLQENAVKQ